MWNKKKRRFRKEKRYRERDERGREKERERARGMDLLFLPDNKRRERLLYTRIVNRGMVTMRLTVLLINSRNKLIRHKSIDSRSS